MSREVMQQALDALLPFTTPNWAGSGVDECNEAYAALEDVMAQPDDLTITYMAGYHARNRPQPVHTEHSATCRNLAAKLRTITANPQDDIFIYRAAAMLDAYVAWTGDLKPAEVTK